MDIKQIKEKSKIYLTKLQNLEEKQKKIIMWVIVVILGLIMGYFWVKSVMYKLENLGSIEFNMPQIETTTELENNTQIEVNNLSETQNQINNSDTNNQ